MSTQGGCGSGQQDLDGNLNDNVDNAGEAEDASSSNVHGIEDADSNAEAHCDAVINYLQCMDESDYCYDDDNDNSPSTDAKGPVPFAVNDAMCLEDKYKLLQREFITVTQQFEKCQDQCKAKDKAVDLMKEELMKTLQENKRLKRELVLRKWKDESKRSFQSARIVEGNQDPLKLLPEEIWLLILELMAEPSDLENCAKTCRLFEKLLEPQKSFYLFPKVFKIVDAKCRWRAQDIFNFRLTSSIFKREVDDILQTRSYRYNFHYVNQGEGEYFRTERFMYTFNDSTALNVYRRGTQFLERWWLDFSSNFYIAPNDEINPHYKRDRKLWSPIASRHLILTHPNPPFEENNPEHMLGLLGRRYRNSTEALLRHVGRNLWYLDVWDLWFLGRILAETWYNILLEWLQYTPNLKVLQFKYPYDGIRTLDDNPVLRQVVIYQPFRYLKQLVMLTMENAPMVLITAILKDNKHIKMLQIIRSDRSQRFHLEKEVFDQLENLRQFAVSLHSEEEFSEFEQLGWNKLESLYLNLSSIPQLDWGKIFRSIERFQETLTSLIVKLPSNDFVRDAKGKAVRNERGFLALPNLKTLKLYFRHFSSIDFIFRLTSLEELSIVMEHLYYGEAATLSNELETVEMIKITGFEACLENSNIWEVLPSLNKVDFIMTYDNYGIKACYHYKYRKANNGKIYKSSSDTTQNSNI